MSRKPREQTPKRSVVLTGRTKNPVLNEEEERILQKAQIYLLFEAKRPLPPFHSVIRGLRVVHASLDHR
jgi:hypothetical protein